MQISQTPPVALKAKTIKLSQHSVAFVEFHDNKKETFEISNECEDDFESRIKKNIKNKLGKKSSVKCQMEWKMRLAIYKFK